MDDTIKLRILDNKRHKEFVIAYDMDIVEESNLYVTFEGLTKIQKTALEVDLESGDKAIYRLHGDEVQDYGNFQDIDITCSHEYDNFEDYYNNHKSEYMGGAASDKREHKRVHEGLHDIIHFVSKKIKCNNVTATTTMLLQFGAYEFYTLISKDDFETINNAYFNAATSAMKYKHYFDGVVTKTMLSQPAHVYANSRAVTFDINRKDKQITFYQTDFVFKTLENIHRVGFEGNYSKFGYELLISIALHNSEVIEEIDLKQEMYKLYSPTIEEIETLAKSGMLK